MIDLIQ